MQNKIENMKIQSLIKSNTETIKLLLLDKNFA